MRPAALALALLALDGCAVSLETARASAPRMASASRASEETRCHALADREALWSSLSTSATLVAGVGGAASIPVEDRLKPWTLGTGVAAAAFAAFAQLYGRRLSEAWARDCTGHKLLDAPENEDELASGLDACARAAKKIAALGCTEARPDFAAFCRHSIAAGIPLCPTRLARITSCAEVATVCR